MILDELDSGVGARLGRAVGQTLRRMTRSLCQPTQTSQILCVSHLPQVQQYCLSVRPSLGPSVCLFACLLACLSVCLNIGACSSGCFTQVAAYADNHLCVRKAREAGGRIQTTITALDGVNDSAQEIAAMLGEIIPSLFPPKHGELLQPKSETLPNPRHTLPTKLKKQKTEY